MPRVGRYMDSEAFYEDALQVVIAVTCYIRHLLYPPL